MRALQSLYSSQITRKRHRKRWSSDYWG